MNHLLTLKQRIMWRIYVLWTLRMLVHPRTLKVAVLAVFLWRSTSYVSYMQVLHNAPSLSANLGQLSQNMTFAQSAFTHTESTTLALLGGVALVAIWMIYDIFPRSRRQHAALSHA